MKPPPLRLIADDPTSLAALEPAVSSAAAKVYARIAIDLGRLPRLEIPDVRQLIRLRRIAHDRGTSVDLHVGSPTTPARSKRSDSTASSPFCRRTASFFGGRRAQRRRFLAGS